MGSIMEKKLKFYQKKTMFKNEQKHSIGCAMRVDGVGGTLVSKTSEIERVITIMFLLLDSQRIHQSLPWPFPDCLMDKELT